MVTNIVEHPAVNGAFPETLDLEQYLELLLGPTGLTSAFSSDADRCWAWQEHGPRLLSLVDPGSRPWGWWQYDAPEAPSPREPEIDYLARRGLLTEDERARLHGAGVQVASQATRKP